MLACIWVVENWCHYDNIKTVYWNIKCIQIIDATALTSAIFGKDTGQKTVFPVILRFPNFF